MDKIKKNAEVAVIESYRQSEAIAARKHPHLYRVASLFPERDRYLAFCAAYASMRWIDDRVDDDISSLAELENWEKEIKSAFRGESGSNIYGPALAETFRRFELPLEPWEKLAGAMKFDLQHSGFESYDLFLDYAEGATVAPAAIFASLLLQRPEGDRFRLPLPYDEIRKAVRNAAIVCYEVHILRDAREDLAAGRNYFPRDELAAFQLADPNALLSDWKEYLSIYGARTRHRQKRALIDLEAIEVFMTSREKLMLHLLIEFYIYSLDKMNRLEFDIWSDRHALDRDEMTNIVTTLYKKYDSSPASPSFVLEGSEDV
ncbi:putative 15-cis-phytoene synthase [Candidatus Zixiibacteriota bacterium]|nr:putative 15-cis-phytoene synthase [candidate division Zixibacteria bacterium]